MNVSDLMKTKFLFFYAEDPLYKVALKLKATGQKEAPVVWQGKFIGMISFSSIASALTRKKLMDSITQAAALKMRSTPIRGYVSRIPMFTRITLDPKMSVAQAIAVLANRNADCIPVVDRKRKLVGVVLASDLRKPMLETLSFGLSSAEKMATKDEPWKGGKKLNTTIDKILDFVLEKGTVSAEAVAKEFKLPVQTIEDYAISLEKHGLIKIEYSILGEMKIKKVS